MCLKRVFLSKNTSNEPAVGLILHKSHWRLERRKTGFSRLARDICQEQARKWLDRWRVASGSSGCSHKNSTMLNHKTASSSPSSLSSWCHLQRAPSCMPSSYLLTTPVPAYSSIYFTLCLLHVRFRSSIVTEHNDNFSQPCLLTRRCQYWFH